LATLAASVLAAGRGGQSAGPAIVFQSPEEGAYVSGPTPIRIRVEPAGLAVDSVSISADGKIVCRIDRPPFQCAWDAGPNVEEHVIRASAQLADGSRVARTIRTRAIAYAERVDVDVVQITATVTDGNGEFVRGLTRDAFRVYEDDVRQRISTFLAQDVPLEIIVAVDISGSMRTAIPTVKQAVKTFLSSLEPADRVTLMGFNDNPFTLTRPSADLAARLRAVDRMAPWGGTALYDLVVRAIDQLGRQTGRRALVVFTDGEDLDSRVPAEAAERRLEASDAMLYAIGQGRATEVRSLKRVLETLAQKSGGRAFFEDLQGLEGVFARIIEELSHQYLLGYERQDSARDTRWRKLRVEVPGRNLKVRARQGYRVVER
jgi:VWFA-related protein